MLRRHLYYYTHLLERPGELVEESFRGDPAGWLPSPAELSDDGWLVDLHADGVLLHPLARQQAEVQVSPASVSAGCVMRAVSWHAARADRLFPVFTGDLELTPLPVAGWHLSLVGTYRPPLSVVGGAADRMLGHRVAEACVRRFVLDIADRLVVATLAL